MLPNSIHDLKNFQKLVAEPAELKNGKTMMDFITCFAPKHSRPFVGMMLQGGSLAWKSLRESLPNIPTVENQVAVFFKLPLVNGEDRRLEPVIFTPLPTNFQIPFKGREKVMESVADSIHKYYEAVQSGSVNWENMLFL